MICLFNTLRPRQNGRHFADDIFKCIFLNENVWIPIKISLKCVPKGPVNNIPALVQIMACRRPGDKPLSESMMVSLPTHMCVTRPQWDHSFLNKTSYPTRRRACGGRGGVAADETKFPGLDLLKNVNGSGVTKLAIRTECRLQGSVLGDSVRHYGHSGLREAISSVQ